MTSLASGYNQFTYIVKSSELAIREMSELEKLRMPANSDCLRSGYQQQFTYFTCQRVAIPAIIWSLT